MASEVQPPQVNGIAIIDLVTAFDADPFEQERLHANDRVETVEAQTYLLLKNGAMIAQKLDIPDSVKIGAGVVIDSKVTIGENVTLHPFCRIRDSVEIGAGSQIGSWALIDHESSLGENVWIGRGSYVGPLNSIPDDFHLATYSAIMGETAELASLERVAQHIGDDVYTVIIARPWDCSRKLIVLE